MECISNQEAVHVIEKTVTDIMNGIIIPQFKDLVHQAVQERLPAAVQYVIGSQIDMWVKEVIREEIAGKLQVSVEIVE